MENIFIVDDDVQLVLVPNNELDRLLLSRIVDKGTVQIEITHQSVGILGKSVKDAVVIKKSNTKSITISDDTSQNENL